MQFRLLGDFRPLKKDHPVLVFADAALRPGAVAVECRVWPLELLLQTEHKGSSPWLVQMRLPK